MALYFEHTICNKNGVIYNVKRGEEFLYRTTLIRRGSTFKGKREVSNFTQFINHIEFLNINNFVTKFAILSSSPCQLLILVPNADPDNTPQNTSTIMANP